jgi:hypothetical protein
LRPTRETDFEMKLVSETKHVADEQRKRVKLDLVDDPPPPKRYIFRSRTVIFSIIEGFAGRSFVRMRSQTETQVLLNDQLDLRLLLNLDQTSSNGGTARAAAGEYPRSSSQTHRLTIRSSMPSGRRRWKFCLMVDKRCQNWVNGEECS